MTGEAEAVAVSDASLFSASDATGEWVITAHRAFSTTEWMKVTIGGAVSGSINAMGEGGVDITGGQIDVTAIDGSWYNSNTEETTYYPVTLGCAGADD